MDNYFIWKGVSSAEMGLICANPHVSVPQRNAKLVTVPGRSGFLTVDDGSYNYAVKSIECRLADNSGLMTLKGSKLSASENQTEQLLEKLVPWLSGCGEVVFSDEPERYYKACVNKAVPIEYILKRYRAFVLAFDCQPFKYNVSWRNDCFEFNSSSHTFYGQGTHKAEPVITVHGSGNIALAVNGEAISLQGINGHIVIDSEMMDCFKGNENMNNRMAGNFPYLKENGQQNIISCSGSVEKIEVTPNWRWL